MSAAVCLSIRLQRPAVRWYALILIKNAKTAYNGKNESMYVCVHVCMYVGMYVCMHVCISEFLLQLAPAIEETSKRLQTSLFRHLPE